MSNKQFYQSHECDGFWARVTIEWSIPERVDETTIKHRIQDAEDIADQILGFAAHRIRDMVQAMRGVTSEVQGLAPSDQPRDKADVREARGSMRAQWTYDPEAEAYYFAPMQAAPPPYLTQRHVEAIIDIASDGTLAGVELIDNMPPPPVASLFSPQDGGDPPIAKFKPGFMVNEPMNMVEVFFEDVSCTSKPLIEGVYHWIDQLIAHDDGRVVGLNFWIYKPPPPPPAPAWRTIERIQQRGPNDCGIAALAMACGVSYETVAPLL